MIRSMTGFGDASADRRSVHCSVELRSLNNKYFKVVTRLPDEVSGLEAELEGELRRHVQRGSFMLSVKLRLTGDQAASRVNEPALMAYLEHLETVQDKVSEHTTHIDLTSLLILPGVLQPAQEEGALLDRCRPLLLDLTQEAATKLNEMRRREGKALAEDLRTQLDVIEARIKLVRKRAPGVVKEYHAKLAARIRELTAEAKLKVDEHDLIREVAIFADRSDISEELTRIAGHLEQFRDVMAGDGGEPAGRTLDFIAQELLREANTMGSKSADATISRAVVEIKTAIDRIKEQVQNVE